MEILKATDFIYQDNLGEKSTTLFDFEKLNTRLLKELPFLIITPGTVGELPKYIIGDTHIWSTKTGWTVAHLTTLEGAKYFVNHLYFDNVGIPTNLEMGLELVLAINWVITNRIYSEFELAILDAGRLTFVEAGFAVTRNLMHFEYSEVGVFHTFFAKPVEMIESRIDFTLNFCEQVISQDARFKRPAIDWLKSEKERYATDEGSVEMSTVAVIRDFLKISNSIYATETQPANDNLYRQRIFVVAYDQLKLAVNRNHVAHLTKVLSQFTLKQHGVMFVITGLSDKEIDQLLKEAYIKREWPARVKISVNYQ